MKNVTASKYDPAQEIRLARMAVEGYYTHPLRAIRVERYLARRYPELREALPAGKQYDFWSPGSESEVLVRLRWYIGRLSGSYGNKTGESRTA